MIPFDAKINPDTWKLVQTLPFSIILESSCDRFSAQVDAIVSSIANLKKQKSLLQTAVGVLLDQLNDKKISRKKLSKRKNLMILIDNLFTFSFDSFFYHK